MSTLVEQLSTYAATLRFDTLACEVVHTAKRLIVDTGGRAEVIEAAGLEAQ